MICQSDYLRKHYVLPQDPLSTLPRIKLTSSRMSCTSFDLFNLLNNHPPNILLVRIRFIQIDYIWLYCSHYTRGHTKFLGPYYKKQEAGNYARLFTRWSRSWYHMTQVSLHLVLSTAKWSNSHTTKLHSVSWGICKRKNIGTLADYKN